MKTATNSKKKSVKSAVKSEPRKLRRSLSKPFSKLATDSYNQRIGAQIREYEFHELLDLTEEEFGGDMTTRIVHNLITKWKNTVLGNENIDEELQSYGD